MYILLNHQLKSLLFSIWLIMGKHCKQMFLRLALLLQNWMSKNVRSGKWSGYIMGGRGGGDMGPLSLLYVWGKLDHSQSARLSLCRGGGWGSLAIEPMRPFWSCCLCSNLDTEVKSIKLAIHSSIIPGLIPTNHIISACSISPIQESSTVEAVRILPLLIDKMLNSMSWSETYEPRHEKTCLQDFRPGKTQTSLLSYRNWLEAWNLGYRN